MSVILCKKCFNQEVFSRRNLNFFIFSLSDILSQSGNRKKPASHKDSKGNKHSKKTKSSANRDQNENSTTGDKRKIIANAAFPFCYYNGNYSEGIMLDEYNERYCNKFQVTESFPTLVAFLYSLKHDQTKLHLHSFSFLYFRLPSMNMECVTPSTIIHRL